MTVIDKSGIHLASFNPNPKPARKKYRAVLRIVQGGSDMRTLRQRARVHAQQFYKAAVALQLDIEAKRHTG